MKRTKIEYNAKTKNQTTVEYEVSEEQVLEEQAQALADTKATKRAEIKRACYEAIVGGFDTDVKYGEMKHYSLSELSQKNIDDQMS